MYSCVWNNYSTYMEFNKLVTRLQDSKVGVNQQGRITLQYAFYFHVFLPEERFSI